MDAPASACPNCGTPRGPYDRFCTGCAADLGAPGSPIGVVGTLGVMNVAGPSSGQARAQAPQAQRSLSGWVVPGSRSRPFAQGPAGPMAPNAQGGRLSGIGGYPAGTGSATAGADRLWRTLGIANRLLGLGWLALLILAAASYMSEQRDPGTLVTFLAVMALFAIPSLALWTSASRLMTGDPPWLRSVVLLEWAVIVVFTFGLALVPLALIFVLASGGPESS